MLKSDKERQREKRFKKIERIIEKGTEIMRVCDRKYRDRES